MTGHIPIKINIRVKIIDTHKPLVTLLILIALQLSASSQNIDYSDLIHEIIMDRTAKDSALIYDTFDPLLDRQLTIVDNIYKKQPNTLVAKKMIKSNYQYLPLAQSARDSLITILSLYSNQFKTEWFRPNWLHYDPYFYSYGSIIMDIEKVLILDSFTKLEISIDSILSGLLKINSIIGQAWPNKLNTKRFFDSIGLASYLHSPISVNLALRYPNFTIIVCELIEENISVFDTSLIKIIESNIKSGKTDWQFCEYYTLFKGYSSESVKNHFNKYKGHYLKGIHKTSILYNIYGNLDIPISDTIFLNLLEPADKQTTFSRYYSACNYMKSPTGSRKAEKIILDILKKNSSKYDKEYLENILSYNPTNNVLKYFENKAKSAKKAHLRERYRALYRVTNSRYGVDFNCID